MDKTKIREKRMKIYKALMEQRGYQFSNENIEKLYNAHETISQITEKYIEERENKYNEIINKIINNQHGI